MHLVSKYKVVSFGILLFLLVSLVYLLVVSDRVKSFQPLLPRKTPAEIKIKTEIRVQEEINPETPGNGNQIREEFEEETTESLLLTEQIKKIMTTPSNQTGTQPKLEDLDSYVMAESRKNFPRASTILKSANSVESEKEGVAIKLPSRDDEEFTIVMLTYHRTEMMLKLLQHLSGLPKLHQLLLIWNNEKLPGPEISWPKVNYRLRLLSNGKNTLHNRYLPLNIIKTEAIFLLDDDSFVVHERVLEAFRIWQRHRDQIVGFKGRGVKWIRSDNQTGHWEYDTKVLPDRISMVLTGSAFIHRNFMDLYTYKMPKAMRKIIDKTMNCDDIAVNFLVSDAVEKSPIYVPHGKDFLCPGCKDNGLWKDAAHFVERTGCLNQFTKIMGYTPLFKQVSRYGTSATTRDCPSFQIKDLDLNAGLVECQIFVSSSNYSQYHFRINSFQLIFVLLHSTLGSLLGFMNL